MTDFTDLEDLNPAGELDYDDQPVEEYFADQARRAKADTGAKYGYPCEKCRGAGRVVIGYVNVRRVTCHRCKGTGKQKAKPLDRSPAAVERRAKNRARRQERKQRQIEAARNRDRELYDFLRAADWSEFAQSLADQIDRGKELSDRQLESATRMKTKVEANRAKRAQEAQERAAEVNADNLFAGFERAAAAGLKRLGLTLGNLRITKAKDHSKNPGHLYVKRDGSYVGKIAPTGHFYGVRGLESETVREVTALIESPSDTVRATGIRTGTCCCCGRELTRASSIEAGIGPICADRWGF